MFIEEFKEIVTMIFDKQVDGGCSRRRPDVRIDFGSHIVVIECDENQHEGKAYTSCDSKRTMEIFKDCGSRPIVFIRFNPDAYEEDGIKNAGCFKPTTKGLSVNKKEFNERMLKVARYVRFYMTNVPKKEVKTIKLYYTKN